MNSPAPIPTPAQGATSHPFAQKGKDKSISGITLGILEIVQKLRQMGKQHK